MNNFNDVSVACASLGTTYDAPIISIAARAFDRTTGKLYAKFYEEIELASATKYGRIDPTTLCEWVTTGANGKAIFEPTKQGDKVGVASVLVRFNQWCIGQGKGTNDRSGPLYAWCHSLNEDLTWLEHAYHAGSYGLSLPWRGRRDLQTLQDAALAHGANLDLPRYPKVIKNTLDIANHNAEVISATWAALAIPIAAPAVKAKAAAPKVEQTYDVDDL